MNLALKVYIPLWFIIYVEEKRRKQMREIPEEIGIKINKLSLGLPARIALIEATEDIFNRMKNEKQLSNLPISQRIATAAFLACDSKACIAIPKLKRAFGHELKGKVIRRARAILQIPHGTAHEKLDSLCKACEISDSDTIRQAHYFVDALSKDGASRPTNIAATSLYAADARNSRWCLTQKDIYHLTGCTEITQRVLVKRLLQTANFEGKDKEEESEVTKEEK